LFSPSRRVYEPEASIPSFHVGGIKPVTLKDA
jgi:hypothetical protein